MISPKDKSMRCYLSRTLSGATEVEYKGVVHVLLNTSLQLHHINVIKTNMRCTSQTIPRHFTSIRHLEQRYKFTDTRRSNDSLMHQKPQVLLCVRQDANLLHKLLGKTNYNISTQIASRMQLRLYQSGATFDYQILLPGS